MKKLTILSAIILFLSMAVSACSNSTVYIAGNTNGNLNNRGYFVESNGWIYYTEIDSMLEDSPTGFYKMRVDGSEKRKLYDQNVSRINVVNNMIYAIVSTQEAKLNILTMKTDGSDQHIIDEYSIGLNYEHGLVVVNDQIFFSNKEDGDTLYKMKNDGSNAKKLNNIPSYKMVYENEWIYYYHLIADESKIVQQIRRIRMDGSYDSLVADNATSDFIIIGDWVYFSTNDDFGTIFRIGVDGKNLSKVTAFASGLELNTDGKRIYYVDWTTNKLSSINPDGTDIMLLSKNHASVIEIAGGWVFYLDNYDLDRSYRVKLDGSEEQKAYTNPPQALEQPDFKGVGISNANSYSGGLIARQGDWIYYAGAYSFKGIYRIHPDGSGKSEVIHMSAKSINIVSDWIYFTNISQYNSICRVKTDGSGYSLVLDKSMDDFIVKDNWIYFGKPIQKIHTDGTGLVQLDNDRSFSGLQIDGNFIYSRQMIGDAPAFGLNKIKTDGTGKAIITKNEMYSFAVDGNWIYTVQTDASDVSTAKIIRMSLDGKQQSILNVERIYTDYVQIFGINDGWLYFSGVKVGEGLVRIRLDGSSREVVFKSQVQRVYFLQDILAIWNDENKVNISNLDGSNPRTITIR